CSVASTTTAGAMKLPGSMVATEVWGRSLPEIQCTGASKWVPVCSAQVKLFQYQAGPASLYCEMVSILKALTWPNWGGSCKGGKSGESVWVRSMTLKSPLAMRSMKLEVFVLIAVSVIDF